MAGTTNASDEGQTKESHTDEYDLVPWDAHAIPATRPGHLALLSSLAGGPRPKLEGCRILEVGCANGANLLPLTFYRPDISALGVDTSSVQIEQARSAAREIGCENVRFERIDLRELKERSLAPFDFIITHGVLSWVAEDARRALFDLIARHLAPDGVAYVSYNVNPGWKIRGLLREMMLSQLGDIEDPAERTAKAQERALEYSDLLEARSEHPYCNLLRGELDLLATISPSHVTHDHLEAHNYPFWITEIVEAAERHGLAHLSDAGFQPDELPRLTTARASLTELGFAGIDLELYLDLLTNRQIRASILCRAEAAGARRLGSEIFDDEDLYVESRLAAELDDSAVDAMTGAALDLIRSKPRISAIELMEEAGRIARSDDHVPTPEDLERFRRQLLELHERGFIELFFLDHPLPTESAPSTHRLARFEAGRGDHLTTPSQTYYPLDDLERYLLFLLDGTRGASEIISSLLEESRAGDLSVEVDGRRIGDGNELASVFEQFYEETLTCFHLAGLLVPLAEHGD